jgi:hypothetical protein
VPTGPQGPPGDSVSSFGYTFSAAAPPPGNAEVRLNNANQTAATIISASHTTTSGADTTNALGIINTSNQIYLQDKDDASSWQLYNVTGLVTNQGSYTDIPVAWKKGGTALTAHANNVIYLGVSSSSSGLPAGGTAGQVLSKVDTTDYNSQWSTPVVVPPATVAPIMDSAAAVGTATKYAREDHVHPSDTSRAALTQVVRYDAAQTLTDAQQVQARNNIGAAVFDALAFNGMQINGAMDISQELGTTGTSLNGYALDGWRVDKAGTMVVTSSQFTGRLGDAGTGSGGPPLNA